MNAWQSFTLNVVLQMTAITLVAGLLMAMARRRAALRHAIGVLALALVLLSPALSLLLPQASWLGAFVPRALMTRTVAGDQPSGAVDHTIRPMASDHQPTVAAEGRAEQAADVANPEFAATAAIQSGQQIPPPRAATPLVAASAPDHSSGKESLWIDRGFLVAIAIWATGILVLGLRSFSLRRQLRSLTGSIERSTIDIAGAREACRALGLKNPPPIGVSDLAPMPLVIGCWRPLVVLPKRLVESGTPDRLRDVLVHEFAHIVRGDQWVNAAQQIARLSFWPHPGVHWLNHQIVRAREEVCDNFVLEGGDSTDYAQTLLELAEFCGRPRFALGLLGMFSRRWSLEQRISGILNPARSKVTRASRKLLAVVTVVLLAGCTLIGGVGAVGLQGDDPAVSAAPAVATTESAANDADRPVKKVTIQGSCLDQDGQPVPHLWVRVFRLSDADTPPPLLGETRIEKGGRFSIANIEIPADTAEAEQRTYLRVIATSKGYVSAMELVADIKATDEITLKLSNKPATLSGVVTDLSGRPLKGVSVFLPICGHAYVPNCMSSVTDAQGRYAIDDVRSWNHEETKSANGQVTTACVFLLKHPDYALTTSWFTRTPQEVNVQLPPSAVIEGTVFDGVTRKPLGGVMVAAQGIGRGDWLQTRTDAAGRYRLLANRDYFNIWAVADDRIAIAAKNVVAKHGTTVSGVDIHMVRGGFVIGTVFDGGTGKPVVTQDRDIYVAHHGPARPRSGAAVASTVVNDDGTYRLRVAPGANYVYLMSGGTSATVQVADGGETRLDLTTGEHRTDPVIYDDADFLLRSRLIREAEEEDQELARLAAGEPPRPKVIKRQRAATPTGRLLDKLEEQNDSPARFQDTWLRTLKGIADLGPHAMPELIAELDSTTSDMMLRSCGFTLRAIGDKRAVPALIRAIPKTLVKPGSDMGLLADDAELAKWAQKHDLDRSPDRDQGYGFGRPVREVFGALNALTGQSMSERELYNVFLNGAESQRQMKRDLFYREAKRWADWWEQHAKEFIPDEAYARVNLPAPEASTARTPQAGAHFKTAGGASNWVLSSVFDPKAHDVFYDLDTGRASGLPKKWRDAESIEAAMDDIVHWAADEGYDLMGTEYTAPDGKRYYALRPLGMQTWELGKDRWKMQSTDVTIDELKQEGLVTEGLLLHFDLLKPAVDPAAIGTFLYVTREGTPGLLYVGIEVRDTHVVIGAPSQGDSELDPVGFHKGRRFGYTLFEEVR